MARPSRREYLARLQHDASLHAKIQELTDELEQEKQASVLAVSEAQQPQPKQPTKPAFVPNEHSIALNIQFYDPKQLLSSVSQSVAVPYFNLCQLFLEKSIELCSAHYRIESSLIEQLGTFDQNGITLSVDAKNPNVAECLIMIGNVFQVLSEVLYKRYREEKRFVLQTRCATANMVEDMQLDAVQAATRLAQSLSAKESALYLNATLLKKLSDHYKLINFPNPSNLLTRHAYIISGMSEAYAERVEAFRTDILKGKKPKPNTFK